MSLELATINPNATLRRRRDGKVIGQRIAFEGSLSASDIRKELKAAGLKGRELTKKVNKALSGSADVRWMRHDALASDARSRGFVPDYADVASNGKAMVVRYVAPKAEGVDAATLEIQRKNAELDAMKKELEDLKANYAKIVEQAISEGK